MHMLLYYLVKHLKDSADQLGVRRPRNGYHRANSGRHSTLVQWPIRQNLLIFALNGIGFQTYPHSSLLRWLRHLKSVFPNEH